MALVLEHYLSPIRAGINLEGVHFPDVPGVVPSAAAFMIVAGLFAVAGPARRALRVEPTVALRDG